MLRICSIIYHDTHGAYSLHVRRWYGWPVNRESSTWSPTRGTKPVPSTSSLRTCTAPSAATCRCRPAWPGSSSRPWALNGRATGTGAGSVSPQPVRPDVRPSTPRMPKLSSRVAPASVTAPPATRAGTSPADGTASSASRSFLSDENGAPSLRRTAPLSLFRRAIIDTYDRTKAPALHHPRRNRVRE